MWRTNVSYAQLKQHTKHSKFPPSQANTLFFFFVLSLKFSFAVPFASSVPSSLHCRPSDCCSRCSALHRTLSVCCTLESSHSNMAIGSHRVHVCHPLIPFELVAEANARRKVAKANASNLRCRFLFLDDRSRFLFNARCVRPSESMWMMYTYTQSAASAQSNDTTTTHQNQQSRRWSILSVC